MSFLINGMSYINPSHQIIEDSDGKIFNFLEVRIFGITNTMNWMDSHLPAEDHVSHAEPIESYWNRSKMGLKQVPTVYNLPDSHNFLPSFYRDFLNIGYTLKILELS